MILSTREYYRKHRDRILKYNEEYAKKNKDKIKKYMKEYHRFYNNKWKELSPGILISLLYKQTKKRKYVKWNRKV